MARPAAAKIPRLVIIATIFFVVAALYFAQAVLMPLALAILLSFLLAPLCNRLERAGLHRIASVLIVFTVMLLLVVVLGWVVYAQMLDLANRLPQYQDDIALKIRSLVGTEPGALEKAAATLEEVGRKVAEPDDAATQPATAPATQPGQAPESPPAGARVDPPGLIPIDLEPPTLVPQGAPLTGPPPSVTEPLPVTIVPEKPTPVQMLTRYFERLLGPIGLAGIVMVFLIFILLQRTDLRDRLIRLVGFGELNITTQALDDAATRISRYLLALAIVNGTYGIAISIGLWIIGYVMAGEPFPNFVLWGLLCALLRFIPYVGPWIAAAFPLAMAFAVFPGFSVFVTVAIMFIVVEVLSNNLMEPWLYGASTGMTTVAVIFAAVFWTWLWGPLGLVMATPLTVCLVVIGKYVPQLKFFDIILGDEPVLSPPERIYQRLLAMDSDDVVDLADEYLRESESLEHVYENVLLPAMAMAEQDRHRGNLDDRRRIFIRQTLRSLIEELNDEYQRQSAKQAAAETVAAAKEQSPTAADKPRRTKLPKECVVNVVCLPAHDEADEIAGIMLAQILSLRGYCAEAIGSGALVSEKLDAIEKFDAHLVCVSALPPAAVSHARYLCKRIHSRYPGKKMIVGLWSARGELKRAKERITCGEDVVLSSTLAGAQDKIDQLAQPLMLVNK